METGDGGFERLEVLLGDFVVDALFKAHLLNLLVVLLADQGLQTDFSEIPVEVLLVVFGGKLFHLDHLPLFYDLFFLVFSVQPQPVPLPAVPPAAHLRPFLQIQTVGLVRVEAAVDELGRVDYVLEGLGRDFERFLVQQEEVGGGEVVGSIRRFEGEITELVQIELAALQRFKEKQLLLERAFGLEILDIHLK